jgi:hypothetical protein
MSQFVQVRQEQTRRELEQMKADLRAWLKLRRARDTDATGKKILHQTRLEALEKVLFEALAELEQLIASLPAPSSPQDDPGQVYETCRLYDQALVWLHRIWAYFRVKFDQRDDEALGPLLDAADELVWSCYKQVYNQGLLPAGAEIGPPPLPFIEPEYSPGSWEEDKGLPPSLLADFRLPELQAAIQRLPVPLLPLPPWCVHSPWWLVFVPHEVGHQVMGELGLKDSFGARLAVAVREANLPDLAGDWEKWGGEIFADLFSVMMAGPWALRALVEIELATQQKMAVRRKKYPAPVVRLKLMERAAERLQLSGASILAGHDMDSWASLNPVVQKEMDLVDPVLDAALGPLTEPFGRLESLCNLPTLRGWLTGSGQPGQDPDLVTWARALALQQNPPGPPPDLIAPRMLACSAVAAWEMISRELAAGQRGPALNTLKTNTIALLKASGPPGVRGEALQAVQVAGRGAGLAQTLVELSRRQA